MGIYQHFRGTCCLFSDPFGSKYGGSSVFRNVGNSLRNWSAVSVNDTLKLRDSFYNYTFLYALPYSIPFVLRYRAIFLFQKFLMMSIELYFSYRPSNYF
jgi:hypothetical protein